ncbi:nitrogen fixation negative regulator NifL [Methylomonas sp. EFPC3]|uniref:nitrogen fixation negative regulator NifL n=1 Tax=Methylomonas TaxID=416 RepID=UPI00112B9FDC|nr:MULTISPECIES: nitrogen fixation negative regulator NifL [Methylomonas]TPQ27072.1 nitrogen fixation negative regulator NifL [Methylomonas koyamae]WFP51831.1 nitrogen fixation negative regulator NifL [Methylomonas sp. EFPC3]
MSKSTPDFLQSQIDSETAELLTAAPGSSPAVAVAKTPSKTLPFSLFVKAVEQAPVAISITDKKANILYINDAFTEVTGYNAAEILGKNESQLSDKSTPRQIYYDLWHTISRKQVWHGQLVNRQKMGQRYLADLTIAPMLDERGAISHYIGMHRDVTQAHYAEQQVNNQKQLIESVLNASPVAMAVLDSDKRVVLDNQMYKMLISELDKDEPALFFLDALEQEMGDLWSADINRHQGFANREIRIEGSGLRGARWFSCSGNWFIENDVCADSFFARQSKDYLLLTLNDITTLRRQQEKLQIQSLRTLLAEEEHIRSIRETLLGAMHQIRQPLNQINAAIQIMGQRNDASNGPLRELLGQVQKMGEETLETLQRCVPEIPEAAVVPVNLNQLLHEVMLLHSNKFLANGVVVDWLPNPVLPNVLGSENKLRMLFKQLIDNAVDAMNRAGSRERLIKITTATDRDWVNVTISDSGPGIPANQRSKVFEPFFTTSQNLKSAQAGMGLVMVKEIVNQHSGMIEIDPDYQNGCSFKLGFPCQKNSAMVSIHD